MKRFLKKFGLKKLNKKGFALVLVAMAIPVILAGINYAIKLIEKSNKDISKFEVPYIVALSIANHFNPGKSWDEQEDYLYSIGAQAYNDRHYHANKKMAFSLKEAKTLYRSPKKVSAENLVQVYNTLSSYSIQSDVSDVEFDQSKGEVSYDLYSVESGDGSKEVSTITSYEEDTQKLTLSFDKSDNEIICKCGDLKRVACATLPRCDVDIVIAVPTNYASSTEDNSNDKDLASSSSSVKAPIREISRAYQVFLQNFLHIPGVAVGVIPYSGKISLPPDRKGWAKRIPLGSVRPNEPYVMQSMFYASDGKFGGELFTNNPSSDSDYGDYTRWGKSDVGLPIMGRFGGAETHRGVTIYTGSGDLLSMEEPKDDKCFMQMNPNPCYLGYCNLLAALCEKDCPTYMANPYFITELTSDLTKVIHDLSLFVPINDKRNKSNFLFLPILWAGNLFSSWAKHPSDESDSTVTETGGTSRERVVIIVANAPDNFEPVELTYLGFNNDYSEIPMYESDTILFNRGGYVRKEDAYLGVKGAIKYTSEKGSPTINGGLVYGSEGKARISFPNKGIIKVVVAKNEPANVTFYDENGVTSNVGSNVIRGSRTFSFSGPQRVSDFKDQTTEFKSGYYTTKGPNFGHNLSTKKLKFKTSRCILSKVSLRNQILRFYGTYDKSELGNKDLIKNSSGKTEITKRMDPCIELSSSLDSKYYEDLEKCEDSDSATWSEVSSDSRSYIKAHNCFLTFKGVNRGKSFIMAAGGFPQEKLIYDKGYNQVDFKLTSAVTRNGKDVKWSPLGNVFYKQEEGVKYRCYDFGGVLYEIFTGRTPENNIKIYTGGLYRWGKLAYYNEYVTKRKRSRSLEQTITTTREYNNTGVTVNEQDGKKGARPATDWCCHKYESTSGNETSTSYNTDMGCEGVVWDDVYPATVPGGWEIIGGKSVKEIDCSSGEYKPKVNFTTIFQKTQEQDSASCEYDESREGKSRCKFKKIEKESACGENTLSCTGCVFDRTKTAAEQLTCSSTGSCTHTAVTAGSDDEEEKDDDGWDKEDVATGRFYKILNVNSDGIASSIKYETCDSNGENCQDFTVEEGKQSDYKLYPEGTFDETKSCLVAHGYDLHNFFLVNKEEKSAKFGYTNTGYVPISGLVVRSTGDSNLKDNEGIYLLRDENDRSKVGITGWICFCGDGDLSMDFVARDDLSISFSNISESHRVSLDNGVVVNTVGTETTSIENTQTFYIIPEQILDEKDNNGNYYVEMNIAENTKIISVEINNRPYKEITPTVEVISDGSPKKLEGEESIFISGNRTVEFITNLKTDFQLNAKVPQFWIDTGTGDYRQTTGNIDICSNVKTTVEVSCSVPDKGAGMYVVQEGDNKYKIFSDRKLSSVVLKGKALPRATVKSKDAVYVDSYSWSREDLKKGLKKTLTIPKDKFKHTSEGTTCNSLSKDSSESYGSKEDAPPEKATVILHACEIDRVSVSDIELLFQLKDKKIYSDISTEVKVDCGAVTATDNEVKCSFVWTDGTNDKGITFKDEYPRITVDMEQAFRKYGIGNIGFILEHTEGAPYVGVSYGEAMFSTSGNSGTYSQSALCMGPDYAKIVAYEVQEHKNKDKHNYLKECSYKRSFSTDLEKTSSVKFHGIAKLEVKVSPIEEIKFCSKTLSDPDEGCTSFGAYSYTISESSTLIDTDVTCEDSSYEIANKACYVRKYRGGTVNGTSISDGETKKVWVSFQGSDFNSDKKYYIKTVSVKNAEVDLSDSGVLKGRVGNTSLSSSKDAESEYLITISPANYPFELKDDGLYHVRIPCENVYISNLKVVNTAGVRVYDHPDIKTEKLANTRILDGYDQGKNKQCKVYGEMKYDNISRNLSPVQKLFYPIKGNSNTTSIYPYKNIGSQIPGDFFIHIWDQEDVVPAVKWKLGGQIRYCNYTVGDYGTFRSNYTFAGLHRMFFPYDTYGKDYAAFQGGWYSAVVFTGFTIPVNLMLVKNGYQVKETEDSGIVTKYTEPNAAIAELARAACGKLKELSPEPKVYLIKYRTDKKLSLENCKEVILKSADSEDDLKNVLNEVAKEIKLHAQTNDLVIDVKDLSSSEGSKSQT